MTTLFELISNFSFELVTAILGVFGALVSYLTYRQGNRIAELEEEVANLKRVNLQISGKVDPESDRKLIREATESVRILGTNSLGPLHHCMEELVEFLQKKRGVLKILLLDPDGEYFRKRVQFENDGVGRLQSELTASARIIREIAISAAGRGKVEVKLYNEEPTRSLIVVDGSDEHPYKARMMINYYPHIGGVRGYEGGQFLSERSLIRDQDSYEKNWSYFEGLWQKSPMADMATLGDC